MGEVLVTKVGDDVIVTRADDVIEVAAEFLEPPYDPRFIEYDGETLTITAKNGTWKYQRGPLDVDRRCFIFTREETS